MANDSQAYVDEIQAWRQKLDASLRREEGWLALVGLHWLKPGVNRAGAGPEAEVALPKVSAPDHLGVFRVDGGTVRFEANPGAAVTCEGHPVAEIELQPDTSGSPTRLRGAASHWRSSPAATGWGSGCGIGKPPPARALAAGIGSRSIRATA